MMQQPALNRTKASYTATFIRVTNECIVTNIHIHFLLVSIKLSVMCTRECIDYVKIKYTIEGFL